MAVFCDNIVVTISDEVHRETLPNTAIDHGGSTKRTTDSLIDWLALEANWAIKICEMAYDTHPFVSVSVFDFALK